MASTHYTKPNKIYLVLSILIITTLIVSCGSKGNPQRIAKVKPEKIEITGDLSDYLQVVDNVYEIVDDLGGKLSIKVKALKPFQQPDLAINDIKISASILGESGAPISGTGEFEIFASSKEKVVSLLKKGVGEEVIELGSDITQYDGVKHASKSKKFVVSGLLLKTTEFSSLDKSTEEKNTGIYYVNKEKASFYVTPSITAKRKAYLVRGDEINISKIENGFGYTEYVSPYNNITTKGWLQMAEVAQNTQTNLSGTNESLSEPEEETTYDIQYSSSDCDKFMNNYEAFINSYIKLIKRYKANPADVTILSEYTEALEKVSKLENNVSLCTDTKYALRLLELQNKVARAAL